MSGIRAGKFATLGTASLLAVGAMTIGGPAAPANADVDFAAVTTGPLFAIAQGVGFDTIVIEDHPMPHAIGDLRIGLNALCRVLRIDVPSGVSKAA